LSWQIEPLTAAHRRDQFTSGQTQLDTYIRQFARQHARKGFGRTFVAVTPGDKTVRGYYTLSSSSVVFEHIPDDLRQRLPRYPIPVVLLGKLAVDQNVQRQGLGEYLLVDALRRVTTVAEQMGIYALEVHAIDQQARKFYTKYGFQPFRDDPSHLFMPMETIKQLFPETDR